MSRSTRPRLHRPTPGWSHRPRRAEAFRRRTRRLPRRQRQCLGLLLLLALAGALWWGGGHVPTWLVTLPVRLAAGLHLPLGWLDLGLLCLVPVGLLALSWWGSVHLRRWREARTRRLQRIAAVDPLAFEQVVGQLFARDGYAVRVTPASGDKGVDLWLSKPGQPAIPVQCKRYRTAKVGSPELQTFSGALRYAGAEEGIFVTTTRFTPQAVAWAKQEHIRLIDGPALARWQRRLERRAASLERRAGPSLQEN